MAYGFVYLLRNEAMPCYYKIGCTERAPHQRAVELSSGTAVPLPFKVVCYVEVEDCQVAERLLHGWLGDFRANAGREFFVFRPSTAPWLIGLFKFYPWQLAYSECDLSWYLNLEEEVNPWNSGDIDYGPELPSDPPVLPGELRLVA